MQSSSGSQCLPPSWNSGPLNSPQCSWNPCSSAQSLYRFPHQFPPLFWGNGVPPPALNPPFWHSFPSATATEDALPPPVDEGSSGFCDDQEGDRTGYQTSSPPLSDIGDAVLAELSDISDIEEATQDEDLSSILDNLGDFFDVTESSGPDTLPKLAKIVNAGFRSITSQEKTKSLCDKYNRPGNCQNMTVPKINEEIFQSINRHSLLRDKGFQFTQKLVLCAAVPLIRIMESFLDKSRAPTNPRESLRLASDSLQLLASAFSSLSQRRKDLLRPLLGDQYRRLCGASNPVTDLLLGDDLAKQVKEINDAEKLRKDMRRCNYDTRKSQVTQFKRQSASAGRGFPRTGFKQRQAPPSKPFLGYKPRFRNSGVGEQQRSSKK